MKYKLLVGAIAVAWGCTVHAAPILIVNGSLGTSEPGTTTQITDNLKTLHEAVGNTVTVSSDIPVNLAPYAQVWDLRFSNVFALTAVQQTQYLSFLQSGGGMFLMGENNSFMTRNNSILDFITLAGGGALAWAINCDGVQQVNSPFTGPNPVTSVNYPCAGGVSTAGTGSFITERSNGPGGSGIAWSVGDMTNAPSGALTVVFDVNFMQNSYVGERGEQLQNLTKNLIGFVGDQVNPPTPVPEPATLALLGVGLAGLGALRRRKLQA